MFIISVTLLCCSVYRTIWYHTISSIYRIDQTLWNKTSFRCCFWGASNFLFSFRS